MLIGKKKTKQPVKPAAGVNGFIFAVLCLTMVAATGTVVFTGMAVTRSVQLMRIKKEYAELRELARAIDSENAEETQEEADEDTASPEEPAEITLPFLQKPRPRSHILPWPEPPPELPPEPEPEPPKISVFETEMRAINPDYVCWINIPDTTIDYPVVRGEDNDKYLHTSFSGERNRYGAIFMDYRNTGDFVPHIIIYGHNAASGVMFGDLGKFIYDSYRQAHPIITLRFKDEFIEYEIFSARITTVRDSAYFLDFDEPGAFAAFASRCGAPKNTAQILTLSTCLSGDYTDDRIIIQAMLKS